MINLKIITPSQVYLEQEVDYVEVKAPHSVLGILPKHAPLVSSLEIGLLKIKMNNATLYFAAGEGIINVRKDETIILLSSIERVDEIDINRAIEAKKRAEERLLNNVTSSGKEVDKERASKALSRAINRIKIYSDYSKD